MRKMHENIFNEILHFNNKRLLLLLFHFVVTQKLVAKFFFLFQLVNQSQLETNFRR